MSYVIEGTLVLVAVVIFLGGIIRAENKAHSVLQAARKELLGYQESWHGHPFKNIPPMGKLEQHPNYPHYAVIYRQEQKKVLKQIGVTGLISCALILISKL